MYNHQKLRIIVVFVILNSVFYIHRGSRSFSTGFTMLYRHLSTIVQKRTNQALSLKRAFCIFRGPCRRGWGEEWKLVAIHTPDARDITKRSLTTYSIWIFKKVCNARDGDSYPAPFPQKPIVCFIPAKPRNIPAICFFCFFLHWWERRVEIHNSFRWFGSAADGFLILVQEEDMTLMQKITKTGEMIQTLDNKLAFV